MGSASASRQPLRLHRVRAQNGAMATLLAFHAHPDDEVLFTGGTLAMAAAEGHRAIVVVATDGTMDAVPEGSEPPRLAELRRSAAELGVARVVHLGYADSGHGPLLYPDPPDRPRFARAARADPEEAAGRLAAVLREERVDLLLSYDPNGGYGHRDHISVHQVGQRGAELAGTPRVLEATVPRETVARPLRLARLLRLPLGNVEALGATGRPRAEITHAIRVGRFARRKQRALAAHRSQLDGTGRSAAVFRALTRLPVPLFGVLLGREWYTEVAHRTGGRNATSA